MVFLRDDGFRVDFLSFEGLGDFNTMSAKRVFDGQPVGEPMAQVVLTVIHDDRRNEFVDEVAFSEQSADGPLSEDAGSEHCGASYGHYLRRGRSGNLPAQSDPREMIWTG